MAHNDLQALMLSTKALPFLKFFAFLLYSNFRLTHSQLLVNIYAATGHNSPSKTGKTVNIETIMPGVR